MIPPCIQPPHDTHEVLNQPPPLENYNLYLADAPLREGVMRHGAEWADPDLQAFGQHTGRAEVIQLGFLANQYPPELKTHDRYGNRLDTVEYHPAWHELMYTGVAQGVHAMPWRDSREGVHVARAAKHYLLSQVEAGVGCPLTMTFAAVPALQIQPEIAEEWVPRLSSLDYDPAFRPAADKAGCLMGMAMTEKQGGSDVRANTTQAVALGLEGPGEEYFLTGHKWFCSAPMCDAFLTLAQTGRGLSCFLVPRWLPDGTTNRIFIQRLKDKLGNRANASSEIEFSNTWARMVGEDGRGVPTIIEMVNHTRLDCVIGSTALMRQALVQAIHHCRHRSAFGERLIAQPLMRNVLTDLTIECEAATTLMLHLAGQYDAARMAPSLRAKVRLETAISKYWVCKRAPGMITEALECHGGAGYVEESIMPRLYREAPLSSIWEGSGNVICLDVLRAITREPESIEALMADLEATKGRDPRYDAHLNMVQAELMDQEAMEPRARRIVEGLALALQGNLLLHAEVETADAFCAARLAGPGAAYGTLPKAVDQHKTLERAFLDHSDGNRT